MAAARNCSPASIPAIHNAPANIECLPPFFGISYLASFKSHHISAPPNIVVRTLLMFRSVFASDGKQSAATLAILELKGAATDVPSFSFANRPVDNTPAVINNTILFMSTYFFLD